MTIIARGGIREIIQKDFVLIWDIISNRNMQKNKLLFIVCISQDYLLSLKFMNISSMETIFRWH